MTTTEAELTTAQKEILARVRADAPAAVPMPVAAARKLVAMGLIKSDGTKGHGKARAAYVAA